MYEHTEEPKRTLATRRLLDQGVDQRGFLAGALELAQTDAHRPPAHRQSIGSRHARPAPIPLVMEDSTRSCSG
jgi:hypothetical protein